MYSIYRGNQKAKACSSTRPDFETIVHEHLHEAQTMHLYL